MINYNDFDLGKRYDVFEEIISFLGGDPVDDNDVWDEAKESKEIPVFENILLKQTLERIEKLTESNFYGRYEKLHYFINASDTHLYINDEEVSTLTEFKEKMGVWE